jgi:hypothetical protein
MLETPKDLDTIINTICSPLYRGICRLDYVKILKYVTMGNQQETKVIYTLFKLQVGSSETTRDHTNI